MVKNHIVEIVDKARIQETISLYEANGYSLVPPIILIKEEVKTFFILTFEYEF